ncbi:MAG: L-histidine N(alpha)-methyltransferase [Acidimicrobiales bacterium]
MSDARVEQVVDVQIDVHLGPTDLASALRTDVRAGLTARPKSLPPKWLYDEVGSALFDEITRIDEYYPTEAEREILLARAAEMVDLAGADTIVELGSGTSDKTRALLDAARADGRLRRFVPFDVSEEFLRAAAESLAKEYPGVRVHGVVGDFDRHLDRIPAGGRRLIVFLGGTIGNYPPEPRRAFLDRLTAVMAPGDMLLLGTDLVKDPARLELAYDDPAGVTAAFILNVLRVEPRARRRLRPRCVRARGHLGRRARVGRSRAAQRHRPAGPDRRARPRRRLRGRRGAANGGFRQVPPRRCRAGAGRRRARSGGVVHRCGRRLRRQPVPQAGLARVAGNTRGLGKVESSALRFSEA